MPIPPLPPLRVRDADSDPNLLPIFEIVFSGATLTRVGNTGVQVRVDSGAGGTGAPAGIRAITYAADADLTAERILTSGTAITVVTDGTNAYVSLITPVSVSSGGTGVATFTAFGVLYGSGGSALQALAAMSSGQVLVGSSTTTRPHALAAPAAGQYLIGSLGTVGGLAWINTAAAGGGGATTKTLRIPMSFLTVEPNSANAYWATTANDNLNLAGVRYVDSGDGAATWYSIVPQNIAATPAWNLDICSRGLGTTVAGTALVTVEALAVGSGEDLTANALTRVSSAAPLSIFRANTLSFTPMSGGNFDSVVPLVANDLLFVDVVRHGGSTLDTVSSVWEITSVLLKIDVTG